MTGLPALRYVLAEHPIEVAGHALVFADAAGAEGLSVEVDVEGEVFVLRITRHGGHRG